MEEAKLKPIYHYEPLTDSTRVIRWDWEGDPSSVLILDPRQFDRIKEMLHWDLIVIDDSDPFRLVLVRADTGLFPIYYQYQYWFLRRVLDCKFYWSRIILTLAVWGLATVEPGDYLDWNRVNRSTKIGLSVLILTAIGAWMIWNAVRN